MGRPKKAMRDRLLEWFGDLPPESRPRVIADLKLIDATLLRREQQEAENGDKDSPQPILPEVESQPVPAQTEVAK